MAAPIGAEVSLYYDSPETVETGDYLQTNTGRTYLIVKSRRQERGICEGRQHLRGVVITKADIEPGAKVHPIHWYERGHAD